MKQKQQICWRLLLWTLLANQVCECECVCVCVCLFRAAGTGFPGEVFCLNFQGHSTHRWVRSQSWTNGWKKVRGKGKRGGEVKDSANESDKESVPPFSYHPLLLHICSSLMPWGKRERGSPRQEKGKKGKKGKKEKNRLCDPLVLKGTERVREGKLQKANWN